jgi:mannosylfructose-phosphate synthase
MVSTHGYVAAIPPLGAADTGGQVVYVLELSRQLAALGFEVDIWTRQFEDQPELEAVAPRVRIIRARCGGSGFIGKEYLADHLDEWSGHALGYIRRHGLSYQFVNSHYWDGGVAGQHLAQALGVTHVHTPHSLGLWKQRQMERDFPGDAAVFEAKYNFLHRTASERRLYQESDLVIATSPPQSDLLRTDYDVPSESLRMIPPGYDDQRFFPMGEASREGIRRRLGLSGRVVLAVGRLARNKGYDLLISAFELLARREPEAHLHLAVGGQDCNEQEAQLLAALQALAARSDHADRIHFGSFIADEDLADWYRAADLFVLSSRYEPFGMTAIEAMACGTPTVVTVHGGLYRALAFGRHALFADPFDTEDLGITMAKIFRHPRLRARLSRMGSHRARSLFTWTGIAQQLLAAVDHRPAPALVSDDAEWDEPWQEQD